MEMSQPRLTKIYLITGALSFFAMLICASQYLFFHYKKHVLRRGLISNPAIVILSMAVIANSMLFTLSAGMDAHIRYALPSYTIILVSLVTLFFENIFGQPLRRGCAIQATALKLRLCRPSLSCREKS